MNLCGKLLNNFLHLCCCVVVFILLTRGKTAEVLHLDNSSCTAWPTFGDSASCGTKPIILFAWFLNGCFQNVQ